MGSIGSRSTHPSRANAFTWATENDSRLHRPRPDHDRDTMASQQPDRQRRNGDYRHLLHWHPISYRRRDRHALAAQVSALGRLEYGICGCSSRSECVPCLDRCNCRQSWGNDHASIVGRASCSHNWYLGLDQTASRASGIGNEWSQSDAEDSDRV